nr:hypothetical protein [Rhodococcus sp. KRD162]
MGAEPWGLYPPEINSGRYDAGIGPATWFAGAVEWAAFAGLVAEAQHCADLPPQFAEDCGVGFGEMNEQHIAHAHIRGSGCQHRSVVVRYFDSTVVRIEISGEYLAVDGLGCGDRTYRREGPACGPHHVHNTRCAFGAELFSGEASADLSA